MRARGFRLENILLGLVLLLALLWNLAEAREIRQVQLHTGNSGTRAEITLDARADYRILSLGNPDRLVLDVFGTQLSPQVRLPAGTGIVKTVRSGQQENAARLVFDLHAPLAVNGPHMEWRNGIPVLILQWSDARPAAASIAPPAPTAPSPAPTPPTGTASTGNPVSPASPLPTASTTVPRPPIASVNPPPVNSLPASPDRLPQVTNLPPAQNAAPVRTVQELNRNLRPIIVAIDAGHGGQDPGAIGPSGTREKDITLAVARELARQVNARTGMRAFMTRENDQFVPLAERYQRARRANADVFVSIHADAATNRNASGSSVYVLSLHGASSQAARWLADRENASDLVGGVRLRNQEGTLASVLLDLSQSATQRASLQMAGDVLNGLRQLGKTHKSQVERANFVVLRSPDVPSMLVETAFISNPEDEQRLRQPAYQRQLASAILNGIHQYFTRMPPPGTHYAARREAQSGGSGGASP